MIQKPYELLYILIMVTQTKFLNSNTVWSCKEAGPEQRASMMSQHASPKPQAWLPEATGPDSVKGSVLSQGTWVVVKIMVPFWVP